MDNVVQLFKKKNTEQDAEEVVLTGRAHCLSCGAQWDDEQPEGTIELECPTCDSRRGRFMAFVAPDDREECECGNELFYVSGFVSTCALCGRVLQ